MTQGEPVGKLVVSEIPGIVNGDWENENEGWLTQGVSNLVGGVKFLHKNPARAGETRVRNNYTVSVKSGVNYILCAKRK